LKIYIEVVACILKKKNKILISSRPLNKSFSGFFEFPGGKVNSGEFLIEALKREIDEELDIKIDLSSLFFLKSYFVVQNKKSIKLNFFLCLNWHGKIWGKEFQDIKWIYPKLLIDLKMLKSNKKIIDFLLYEWFPATN